ncbi:MAG TPA: c-type cytochrome [Casimicrobiaceae bacterium]|nr:c-type cytochrome [Casimicrobiaceae bacterium]
MTEEHSSFIKTPKQLAIVVVLAFAVPITLIVLLSQLVTGVSPREGESESDVLGRIQPVGQVTLAEANAPSGNQTGEQVYQTVCKTCHEAGLAGAPKFGDKAAWAPRIKSGADALFASAIKGKNAMPPKGGNTNLADVEVQRAVVYMANRVGASFKEPLATAQAAATAAPPAQAQASAPATPAPAPAAPAAQPPAAAAAKAPAGAPGAPLDMASATALMQKDGCAACHGVDKKIVGPAYQDVAAKYKGDKDAAGKLVQKVKAGGSGVWGSVPMPPNAQVSDADIKALVSWILTLKK